MGDLSRYDIKLPVFKMTYGMDHYVSHYLVEVMRFDPLQIRKALYKIATYFRREFRYDFVQYSLDNEKSEKECRAYIFREHHYYYSKKKDEMYPRCFALGACVFRKRKYKNTIEYWELDWIWLHPYERNQGRLSQVWPYFKREFGDFMVSSPMSNAMKGFLQADPDRKIHMDIDRILIKEEVCKT